MDGIALKHLQIGNVDKAKEIFQKKETFASLINSGVLAFVEEDITTGFSNISKVIHDQAYRSELLQALGIANLAITEDEVESLFIASLLKDVPANKLLAAAANDNDRTIIVKSALDEPISTINSAISVAKDTDTHNAAECLAAGKKLMDATKKALQEVRDIAGDNSPQYQMIADNLAKQILQCGINYYNNAPYDDVESPRKAMELQAYALKIAVGKLTKDRCQENYNILKKAVDNIPPAEVAIEARKIKIELGKFCQLPNKISHSVALLNNAKPLLQTIKTKLGATNAFYLSLSTQVVGNALHNVIEEVNSAQNHFMAVMKAIKKYGVDPSLLNYLDDENSPAKIIDSKVKPVIQEAWKATALMDSFDMESDFKTNRYNPNRQALKEMCESLKISTHVSTMRPSTPKVTSTQSTTKTTTNATSSGSGSKGKWYQSGCLVALIAWIGIGCIAGAICEALDGDFSAGFFISGVIVLLFSQS